jgi:hypothetical protein
MHAVSSGQDMDDKNEKARQIVKSIKMLEGVLKSTPNATQRSRVRKDLGKMRNMLGDMFPGENISAIEETISSEPFEDDIKTAEEGTSVYETLKEINIETISTYKDDAEVNQALSIMRFFEERIWGVIADQHTKLDFSNAGERDTLYRKLDQCSRAYKIFCQTIEDIEKSKSTEYSSQLQQMRQKQGRLFLFDFSEFLKSAKDFISNLIADSEFGGTMIVNPTDKITYADYEVYKTFSGWSVLDALKYIKKFVMEALDIVKMPSIRKPQP